MLFNPAIERLPRPQLRALQNARLREQVGYLPGRVPFYRRRFAVAGVRPAAFHGLEDVPKLGFTKKTDSRDNYPLGLFAVPEAAVARLHRPAGTTGKATVVGCPAGNREIFAEVVARWPPPAAGRAWNGKTPTAAQRRRQAEPGERFA